MQDARLREAQQRIIEELGVKAGLNLEHELERRIVFLMQYVKRSRVQAMVLGISGGVDSLVAACLAQRTAERLRKEGDNVRFIAMRLPYGQQADAADAEACMDVIQPDERLTVDIKPATDALLAQMLQAGQTFKSAAQQDFIVGNIKARQRMVAQYAAAAAASGLVLGSDHAAEALMGFFTKFGDGAADVMPLAGLTKRQVRGLGALMGAPDQLVYKVPTADLEDLSPLRPDEEAFGVSYEQIDDFLEGKAVSDDAAQIMLRYFAASAHKRALPATPIFTA
jgi:NAD+ synthase